jgi:ligand-binding sensor domain-containing protein
MAYDEETKQAVHWNKDNSLLQGVVGDEQRTRISGLAFDEEENLWISNYGSPAPLVVKTKEGPWYRFSVPGSTQLAEIAIDQARNKWVVVPGVGNGILVYNEGASISDTKDDKVRLINRNNSLLTGNRVNAVLVDLDGAVWVGTDQGPVIFDCGDPFQDASCRGNTRPVVVDGIPALLLRDEDILCIEADGANRKWFGTRNGIFVQSPDGTEKIAQFNTQNSPLLNNKVTELSFNALTGDMMIVTASGIQTYRTLTTGGKRTHGSDVYAYPNPVRPDFEGMIAIKGLVRDANVKITDINGRLLYETKALGGQAVWDGRDYNGMKASAGVYLVFSANENTSQGTDAYVTKILIVD